MYELYIRVAAKWLFLVLLTAPKIFAISWSRTKTLAAISQDCRLSVLDWVGHPHPNRIFGEIQIFLVILVCIRLPIRVRVG